MKTIHASAPDPSNQVEDALELDLLHLSGSVGALTKPGIRGAKQVVRTLKDADHRLDTDGRFTSPARKRGPLRPACADLHQTWYTISQPARKLAQQHAMTQPSY